MIQEAKQEDSPYVGLWMVILCRLGCARGLWVFYFRSSSFRYGGSPSGGGAYSFVRRYVGRFDVCFEAAA